MEFPQKPKSFITRLERIIGWIIGLIGFSFFTIHLAVTSQKLTRDLSSSPNGLINSYFGLRRVILILFRI